MAGWLAWNLRIITVAAVACFSYYGADYWSSRNKHESIEKTDFKEFQESEELDEKERIELGQAKPEILTEYLKKVVNDNKWIEERIKKCKETPYLYVYSETDLINRRYCRLYWGVKESIGILIKTENKQVLLSSEAKEWTEKWQEYKKGNKPWGEIDAGDQVPDKFKEICKTKAKELVYDVNVNEYSNVDKFCTRRKTVKDVLDEKGVRLLKMEDSNDESIWKSKLSEYQSTDRGERFGAGQIITDLSSLQKSCEETVKFETMITGYKGSLAVAERYCSIKNSKQ